MEFHEYANIFPMMNSTEFDELCKDMAEHGYRPECPIITYKGAILDGRNRFKATEAVGVLPMFTEYCGDDPLAFVLAQNLHRRHLNETQRAGVAGRLATLNNGGDRKTNQFANLQTETVTQADAAKMLNVSPRTVATFKAVERDAPELVSLMESGEMSAHQAQKKAKEKQRNQERAQIAEAGQAVEPSNKWAVYHGDIEVWSAPRQYDFIITDPPYPREYLPLYAWLAKRANIWLKEGGLLIAMCGESYVNQIYKMMDQHLEYYWTACYLLPGQPTSLRNRNVNTSWKPLLIYSKGQYKGKGFGDVFVSERPDKEYHVWGQSISGMYDIIKKICLPGQYILDPFCGAGTTGIAALKHGCLFDGLDKSMESVNISKGRLSEYDSEAT